MSKGYISYTSHVHILSGLIASYLTSVIGYAIHGSIFWAVVDFIFVPIVWIKWIYYHEVTLTIMKQAFAWFFV